jgi:hypothetical protein
MTFVSLSIRTAIYTASSTALTTFSAASPRSSAEDDFFRGVAKVVRRDDRQARIRQNVLAQVHVGALQAHHQRYVERNLARGRDHAFGDHVATHDAAENVDQDALHVGVREDDLERRGNPLLGGTAADVEEVCRRAAAQLDDVHGRHGQPGAIDHAADRAVELDVVEFVARGLELHGVFLVLVAQPGHVLVAEQRVVVKIHLGVERDHLTVAGHHQRVDLDDAGVELGKGPVHGDDEFDAGADLLALEAEAERDLPAVVGHDTGRRVYRHLENLLRRGGGDLLDVHAALARGHDGDPAGRPVDQHAEVELARDVATVLDVQALDLLAARAGLLGDQHVAEHLAGVGFDLVEGIAQTHTPGALGIVLEAPGATAAGVDLGLDHPNRPAQVAGSVLGFLRGEGDPAARGGDPELRQQALGLIFVNVHERSFTMNRVVEASAAFSARNPRFAPPNRWLL